MNQTDIKQLIAAGESFHFEAKKAGNNLPSSLWETYSAFCNTDGGTLLLGVSESADKKLFVSGVQDSNALIKSFWNQINDKQKVSDNLLFEHQIYSMKVDEKEVVVIEIPRADRHYKPVYINDDLFKGTYRRNADGDYHCKREEIKAMLRDQSDITSDSVIVENVTWQELDKDTIYRFRMRFKNLKPNHIWNALDDVEFLLKSGAIRRNRETNEVHPTLAGILMFGTESLITEQFPDYFLDYREIDGENRWTDRVFSSSGDWSGNLFDFYFKVIDRLTSGLKVPFKLRNGLDRIDDTSAHEALREALANALIHADYNGRRGVVIEKFKDRLEISNPGTLRLTSDEAMEGGISDPRNSNIFKMFVLVNVGERIGSGLQNIRYVWNSLNLPVPNIEERFSPDRIHLVMAFHNEGEFSLLDERTDELTPPVTPPVTPLVTPPVELLNDLEKRFVDMLTANPTLSRIQMSEFLGIGLDTVKEYLRKLREKGYVERIGGNKRTGYWNVKI